MKHSFVIFLAVVISNSLYAQQVPQYIMATNQPLISSSGPFGKCNALAHQTQTLYYPSDFPNAPAGFITKLYIKTALDVPNSLTYSGFMIGMGYIKPTFGGDTVCFKDTAYFKLYPIDTVLYAPFFVMNPPIYANQWLPFTLDKPFYYNGISNFIVDIKPGWCFDGDVYAAAFTNPNLNCIRSQARNLQTNTLVYWDIALLGFDVIPTSVDNVRGAMQVDITPNPSSGLFQLSFDASNTLGLGDISVRISNISGETILSESYSHINGRFSRSIDMTNIAKGLYFVEIRGDKEKLVKKVIMQ